MGKVFPAKLRGEGLAEGKDVDCRASATEQVAFIHRKQPAGLVLAALIALSSWADSTNASEIVKLVHTSILVP